LFSADGRLQGRTHCVDGLDELPREIKEELGFLEDTKGGAQLLSLDSILKDGEEDLIGPVAGDCSQSA
jgi:hypothetical protein